MSDEKNMDTLTQDWCELCFKYQPAISPIAFAKELIILNTKLLLDKAPEDDPEAALDIARVAFKEAIDWHVRSKAAECLCNARAEEEECFCTEYEDEEEE